MTFDEIVRGDISDAFKVTLKDADNVVIPANDANFICKVAVATDDENATVVFSRNVTSMDGDSFLVWLTSEETAMLTAHTFYNIVVQVEKANNLPKPIKKEVIRRRFKAMPGLIE